MIRHKDHDKVGTTTYQWTADRWEDDDPVYVASGEAADSVAALSAEMGGRRSGRDGVSKALCRRWLTEQGWTWVPTMGIGSGCTVHLRPAELPAGRLVVQVSKHVVAVVDGIPHDTDDPTRGGTRCVYGYFTASAPGSR